jgi:outer membrane protein assembly factor BamB
VIEGDRVYTLNREGKLHCLNLVDGSVVWKKDLMSEYELEIPTWAFAASPLVLPDKVIVNVGRVLALNKDNGAPIWSTRDTGHAYSTPIVATLAGLERLVIFNGDGVVLFDPSNGREQAEYTWTTQYDVNAATPIAIGDRLFISSGYNHGCSMLQVTDQGLRPLWENKEMRNQMSGCVYYEGHLYGFDDKTLKCIDTEGNERWAQRGLGQGALMIADGKIIALSSKGELIIADASPGGYAELSRRKILDGGVYWSSPVLSNGLIFCRNSEGEIVCRDHRDAGD